jgi:ribonuclease HI
VLAVHSKTLEGHLDSSLAEARAALLEVQICNELGLTQVQFEGDAKVVVTIVNSMKPD